ncbi:MAG: ribonuclease H-like domain-containing protein [Treponema sp.]|jgi:uncharacterized protein YprB with RNaseH-like and TPR domain|nr:ribonuclease H-like domain-containing protein [Treponema sp.]
MGNLKLRLQRIRKVGKPHACEPFSSVAKDPEFFGTEWVSGGFQVLTRSVVLDPPLILPPSLPSALPILVPDLFHVIADQGTLSPETLVFLDLETTGLSGGAGTTAFLGALGRFVPTQHTAKQNPGSGLYQLQVDQYLLLDYPGEPDFLAALLRGWYVSGKPRVLVSYNGKCFDLPLLKTRCLMNQVPLPRYYHADLLHPARWLWKGCLPDCSQGSIESRIGLTRIRDLPGALAPEIWFSFLKSGEPQDLLRVCEHNQRDILGLASIFTALTHIAASPLGVVATYRYNLENAALRWREALKQGKHPWEAAVQETGSALLKAAATQAYPRAALVAALDLMEQGRYEAGRNQLRELTKGRYPNTFKIAAYRALALDAEWRLQDIPGALAYVEAALSLGELREPVSQAFQHRRERLLGKKKDPSCPV